jgi:hypothetical protein
MSDETKAYRVCLAADGSEPLTVRVLLRTPFNRKVRRHFEVVREFADGRKKVEFEVRDVEHAFDVESEMRADAVRAFNASRATSVSAKNLLIEAIPDYVPEPVVEKPAKGRKHVHELVSAE